jgi:hypothetical protein
VHCTGVRTGTAPIIMPRMSDAFICDAVRTPIGRYGGALAAVRTDDLAAVPLVALLKRNPSLDPAAIEEVLLGCANQAGEDNRNVARMAALLAGLPVAVPGGAGRARDGGEDPAYRGGGDRDRGRSGINVARPVRNA